MTLLDYYALYVSVWPCMTLNDSVGISFTYIDSFSLYLTLFDSIWLYLTLFVTLWLTVTLFDSFNSLWFCFALFASVFLGLILLYGGWPGLAVFDFLICLISLLQIYWTLKLQHFELCLTHTIIDITIIWSSRHHYL